MGKRNIPFSGFLWYICTKIWNVISFICYLYFWRKMLYSFRILLFLGLLIGFLQYCPDGWTGVGSKCYHLSKERMTWPSAQEARVNRIIDFEGMCLCSSFAGAMEAIWLSSLTLMRNVLWTLSLLRTWTIGLVSPTSSMKVQSKW